MTKRKGLAQWNLYNAPDTPLQQGCFIFLIGVSIGILLIVLTATFLPTPTTVYSATYRDCMAHATLTPYQCHQIALEAIDR